MFISNFELYYFIKHKTILRLWRLSWVHWLCYYYYYRFINHVKCSDFQFVEDFCGKNQYKCSIGWLGKAEPSARVRMWKRRENICPLWICNINESCIPINGLDEQIFLIMVVTIINRAKDEPRFPYLRFLKRISWVVSRWRLNAIFAF